MLERPDPNPRDQVAHMCFDRVRSSWVQQHGCPVYPVGWTPASGGPDEPWLHVGQLSLVAGGAKFVGCVRPDNGRGGGNRIVVVTNKNDGCLGLNNLYCVMGVAVC